MQQAQPAATAAARCRRRGREQCFMWFVLCVAGSSVCGGGGGCPPSGMGGKGGESVEEAQGTHAAEANNAALSHHSSSAPAGRCMRGTCSAAMPLPAAAGAAA